MRNITVHSLEEDERTRFFKFAGSLPDRSFWGKKGRFLRGDFATLQRFFEYIEPFQPRRFLVAEEYDRLVGFVVAVYNPMWTSELTERYGYEIGKRAYILGIASAQRRRDILGALINELTRYFSKKGIKSIEYPTLGNVCLTTGTDVLTPENVDALMIFREVGFKINECYYSMKLNLDKFKHDREYPVKEGSFHSKERSIEIGHENEIIGRITWDNVENDKTAIDICVARSHRRKGLGTALMVKALNRLKTEGVKLIELGVDGNNLSALKLYRKFGFKAHATHFYVIVPC